MKRILFALMCAISIFSFSSCDNNKPENPQLEETALSVQQVGSNTTYSMNSSQYSLSERYSAVRELTKWHSDFLHVSFGYMNNHYSRTMPYDIFRNNINNTLRNYESYLIAPTESAFASDILRYEEKIHIYPLYDDESRIIKVVEKLPTFDQIVEQIPLDVTANNLEHYLREELFRTDEFQAMNESDQNIYLIFFTTYTDSYRYWSEHLEEWDLAMNSRHDNSEGMLRTLAKADATGAVHGAINACNQAMIVSMILGCLSGGSAYLPAVGVSTLVGAVYTGVGASISAWQQKDKMEQEIFEYHMYMKPSIQIYNKLVEPYMEFPL